MAAVGFVVPRITYHGIGTLEKLKEMDGSKAFIVTGDSSMGKSGKLDKAQAFLREAGISSSVFEG
ncbi:MAG: NADPH-dependent butanol dehydrogenase, partial [Candidatus Electrothrix sp. EH2]|nr:NADPH-dependent butanol dehydrogenase [Candidatus Electrothrix sp. EH2]